MSGWQPIETAPKDGRFLLLHVPEGLDSGTVTVGAYWKSEERGPRGTIAQQQRPAPDIVITSGLSVRPFNSIDQRFGGVDIIAADGEAVVTVSLPDLGRLATVLQGLVADTLVPVMGQGTGDDLPVVEEAIPVPVAEQVARAMDVVGDALRRAKRIAS